MVRMDRIVTKGGDGGRTSLGDGTRVDKHDMRIEAIGAVDEANAAIGLLRLHVQAGPDADEGADAMLARIQNDLFDVGADLCVPCPEDPGTDTRMRLTDAPALRLEAEVETMNAALPPLSSFILPGGGAASAHAHLARTVARRAERRVAALAARDAVNPAVSRLLNRLSDHLFVLARRLAAGADTLWVPGANRRS